MSLRCCIFCVMIISTVDAGETEAQPRANTFKLVRVTYPVADLVRPIENYSVYRERESKKAVPAASADSIARSLTALITDTVAKETWDDSGGMGTIQYFPLGEAIVVNQTQAAHEEIAHLLAALRKSREVAVSVETRIVTAAPEVADLLLNDMEKHGKPARALRENDGKPAKPANRSFTVDDKRTLKLLELAQLHRATTISQLPKLTLFNGQRAGVEGTLRTSAEAIRDGVRCDFVPIVDADRKNVRLQLDLESVTPGTEAEGVLHRQIVHANATFTVPTGQTLVWHLGETASRNHVFLMATPRVEVVQEEQGVFMGQIRPISGRGHDGETEEQSIPAPKKAAPKLSAKEKAIHDRLRQPISIQFKDVPLDQAIKDLSKISGVQIVPDTRALSEARIDMKRPVSYAFEDVDMKFALHLILHPLRMRFVIEDDAIKITMANKLSGAPATKIYPVGDLLEPQPMIAGQKSTAATHEETLIELIVNTVANDSWEGNGGNGTIQYSPKSKSLTIRQHGEVHEEIQLLLATLRKLQDLQVTLDVRFVHASVDTAREWRKAMAKHGQSVEAVRFEARNAINGIAGRTELYPVPEMQSPARSPRTFVSMNNQQIQAFLSSLVTDRGCALIQVPQLRIYNGQQMPIECNQKRIATAEFRTPSLEPVKSAVARAVTGDGSKKERMIR